MGLQSHAWPCCPVVHLEPSNFTPWAAVGYGSKIDNGAAILGTREDSSGRLPEFKPPVLIYAHSPTLGSLCLCASGATRASSWSHASLPLPFQSLFSRPQAQHGLSYHAKILLQAIAGHMNASIHASHLRVLSSQAFGNMIGVGTWSPEDTMSMRSRPLLTRRKIMSGLWEAQGAVS
ncbi:hypothetical protein BC628DRAFT_440836 [Trametes gibbosa]|nr:hypothetical protein BC628DRAFT_440836 [Trametes gibbosa]